MNPGILNWMAVVGLLAGAGVISASQEEEEEPTTNQGVCDVVTAQNLRGLCRAYCEDPECDRYDPLTVECLSSDPSVLENYNNRKKPEDPEMPCRQVECPCWSLQEIDAIQNADLDFCVNEESLEVLHFGYGDFFAGGILAVGARRDFQTQINTCRYVDETTDPDIVRSMIITDEEFAVCREQIEERGEEIGQCFLSSP